ncbi:CFI-box-CTERM domain-containing protein [Flavobacterium gawalongense]|uniref:Uncharacterized protein n=1 Tax=Flavobacterium gawalongense TaxID=2594432 RepID=A0A553BBJ1_9FLAO|nr:CFI-box-CTERM domain-containing protein [Flavobacterium gawalongense]TRW98008.1 hypothetical protein FNW33_16335 [Flavobacterium gawalongense]TRX02507.1 hypothetical protein FNW12_16240 [Flavobacterium gawalongense]TRX05610.1 hypothetical protein FNW11_15835 [Flavobacterium gawalongense]TRX06493.1 hypothetical protein FNW10_15795 [Flavobacterium gawalongense]TRX25035.1 hypothetical protein FNW38_12355 [Flavobacterium gawalongense]
MSKLSHRQETILSNTRDIFEKKTNVDFIQKLSNFLNKVFPKIERLYENYPNEFEEIENKIHSIILKQDIIEHTLYLKNQDYQGLNKHRNALVDIMRTKIVILEKSDDLRLSKFLKKYGNLIQHWFDSENGSRAILKEVNKDEGHCYVATMVYGDYNHPNVIHLRNFRDNTLNKYKLGSVFIKYYYKYSPYWVKKMKNSYLINKLLKVSIDFIVCKIQK